MEFVLRTGPHHPGLQMYVQRRDGRSAFDMDHDMSTAERFPSKAAALRRAQSFSTMYGLQAVPIPTTK